MPADRPFVDPQPLLPDGPVTSGMLQAQGYARSQISRLVKAGRLVRIARGLYARPDRAESEHSALVEAAAQVPDGVVCLLSALRFHGLTTQAPSEVWLAIGHKARAPRLEWPPLRLVRVAKPYPEPDLETHQIEGVTLQVTDVARTIVDCFKHRNKIGLDVAREALADAWVAKRIDMDSLWRVAKACRLGNVMRPYLESLG